MKTKMNSRTPKALSLSFIALVLLAIGFTSCNKNHDSVVLTSYVMATNASEASTPQDFFVDNQTINGSALAYTQSTNYAAVNSGDRQIQFRTAGSSTVNSSATLSAATNKYYSVFYTDGKAIATYEDDTTAPQSGKARVRFINLSASAGSSVDFGLSGGAKIVSGLAYKAASAYNEVAAATSFSLYANGSTTVLLNIPVTIQAGHIYTVYISGSTAATITYHLVAHN
jgi:hypothetical protein